MAVRIGITTSLHEGEQRLRLDYARAVEAAGGVPLPVPMGISEDTLHAIADDLGGLVITGGPAITDGLVGSLPEEIAATDPMRRRADRAVLRAMQGAGKPVLGICYGMQLLNAAAGGTIYADVERQHAGALVHSQKRGGEAHPVHLARGSRLRRLLGEGEIEVNTRHLQAVATLGDGLRASATAPDGVVEALESDDGQLLGVQFHPERMGAIMHPLFRHLVQRAGRSAASARLASEVLS